MFYSRVKKQKTLCRKSILNFKPRGGKYKKERKILL